MKLVTLNTTSGPRVGRIVPQGIRLVSDAMRARIPTLRHALASLPEIAADAEGEVIALEEADFLPVIPDPGKMICVGKNYAAHAAESGDKPATFPNLFARFGETLVGHGQPIVRPRASEQFDYEGELAIVIGRAGRHIARQDALGHVAGYTCFNDASVRDYQFGHSLLAGKNFAATGALGPVLTTADEVADPQNLEVTTRLNGNVVQQGHTRDMIFDCAWLISYVSSLLPLAPGDIIATGTPDGVGFARKPPVWLKPGDVVEVGIPGIGLLRNTIEEE